MFPISGSNTPFNFSNADKIATVFTCVKILSETLSRMPLNVYTDKGEGRTVDKNDYRYPILHYNPNSWTSQQTFFSSLEYWRNLKGNSFARIYRDNTGKVISLVLIPPSKVIKDKYRIINGELYYIIENDKGEEEVTNASEILHFKGLTKNGIWGLNPLEALRQNLSTTFQGLSTIDNFYKNNAMSPRYIKSTVTGANQKAMIEALNEFNSKSTGPSNAGKDRLLPPNTDIIDSVISLADAEMIATLKFNAQQIAALYGVPPHMIGILESTKSIMLK
jgi:HK97 family phage portal protein